MNLDELGNVAELISAIAVLATLIYLTIQIRQNRQILSAQTLLVAMQNFNQINQSIVADAEVARIWEIGCMNPDDLSQSDASRFFMLARQTVNAYMGLYWLYRDGVLSGSRWKGLGFEFVVNLPGVRRFFDAQAHSMEDDFVCHVRTIKMGAQWNGVAFVPKENQGGV
jgi:hypothetical protein